MMDNYKFRPNLKYWSVLPVDPGWIYVVRAGPFIKVGKTIDPNRRLLREARTWSPDELKVNCVKPFFEISRVEYALHSAMAQHWHRGEWHKFEDEYWLDFFVNTFSQEFEDEVEARGANSVNFTYWMNGTGYAEICIARCQAGLSLSAWRKCHGYPYGRCSTNA